MTLQVELDERHEALVEQRIASGEYGDASAVVQRALEALEYIDEANLAALRSAIDEGDASGLYEGDAIADLRKEFGLPPRA